MTTTQTIYGHQVTEGMHVQGLNGAFFIATHIRRLGPVPRSQVIRIEERTSSGYVTASLSVGHDTVVVIRTID